MGFLKAGLLAAVLAVLLLLGYVLVSLRFGLGAVPYGPAFAVVAREILLADSPAAAAVPPAQPLQEPLPQVASGDVTPTTAVVWARWGEPGEIFVRLWKEQEGESSGRRLGPYQALAEQDYAVRVPLDELEPDTLYRFDTTLRQWLATQESEAMVVDGAVGRFRTAPDPAARRDVSFVFSADVAGGGYCRRVDTGYPIFAAMSQARADFFIAMGDMVYADNTCPATGPNDQPQIAGGFASVSDSRLDWTNLAQLRDVYFQHWRYNRADPSFQVFLRETPMYITWDDHETINDSGGSWSYSSVTSRNRPGYPALVGAARDALFAWAPLARDPADPNRIYRRYRWGADLDLFVLDTRSYRSRNDLADTPENQKTMLGAAQLAWLKDGLARSSATWKLVVSSVPLSAPTGGPAAAIYGSDSWASGTSWDYSSQTGFERELLDLLRSLDEGGVRNLVVLSGDIHQALNVRYEIDVNGDGRPLVFHEITAGPISSSPGREAPQLDPTFNPTLRYRDGGFFNFGYVRVERPPDGLAHFISEIRDADGQVRPTSRLDLTPS